MELTNLDVSSESESQSEAVPRPQDIEVAETSPVRSGPPSEASSQEWDQVAEHP